MTRAYRVFVSSTTSDLGSYRQAVANVLREKKKMEAIDEGTFPTMGYEEVRRLLWEKIQICDAVIFLVGFRFGGEPMRSDSAQRRRSFAQMEWDFAQQLNKPRYVFVATAACAADDGVESVEDEEKRSLQLLHRDAVKGDRVERMWHDFSSWEELLALIEKIDFPSEAALRPRKVRALPGSSLGADFLGRDEEMAALRHHFQTSAGPTVLVPAQAVHGLGGVGKTRLALEYALGADEWYEALLFVSAESPGMLTAGLGGLARAEYLNLCSDAVTDEGERYEVVMRWLEAHDRWLLILDNADTLEAAQAVRAVLPRLRNGHVLITSRLTDWREGVLARELGVLPEAAAVRYLRQRCVNRRQLDDEVEVGAAGALARELGCLALALEQAAAFINLHGTSFGDYHERWRREDEAVRSWFDPEIMRYPRSVATTWETSFANLDEGARVLLQLLSWLSTEPAPRGLFQTSEAGGVVRVLLGVEKVAPMVALSVLASYSLIHRSGKDSVQVHRLVQEVTRQRLGVGPLRRECLAGSLGVVNAYAVGNPHDPALWPVWEPLRPHILSLATWSEEYEMPEPAGRLLNQLGLLLLRKAAYREGYDVLMRALALRALAHGVESMESALVMNNLGTACERLDELKDAEKHYLRAIAIMSGLEACDEAEIASALANVAGLFVTKNDFPLAERYMNLAAKVEDRCLPPDSPQRAPSLSNQGGLLWRMGRYAEAEACYRAALQIAVRDPGAESPEVAAMRSNLGLLLQEVGRYDEAELCFRAALAADQALYGDSHPAVGRDMNNLALLLRLRGRLAEAEQLFRGAIEIDVSTFGPEHSEVADGYNNLGLVLLDLGRFNEAEEVLDRALKIDEAVHGAVHLRVAATCLNLSFVFKEREQLVESLALCQRALDIQVAMLGPDHPNVATSLNNRAKLEQLRGDCPQARAALRRAMRIDRKAFGKRHPHLGTRLGNLAQIYWQEGRLGRAGWLFRAAIIADRAILGDDHPDVAVDYFNYAELLRHGGQGAEAKPYLTMAMEVASRYLMADPEASDHRLSKMMKQCEALLGGLLPESSTSNGVGDG